MTMLFGFAFNGLPSISISMSDNTDAPRDKQIHHKNISTYHLQAKPQLHQTHKSCDLQCSLLHGANFLNLPSCLGHAQYDALNDKPNPCLHDTVCIAHMILPYKI